ncbi:MAG TPA: FISUMP domain-containing protein [Bacteroidales bacterium]|nr:FISUMP domain-containing protein [Bacteroidales bacterium]
MKRLIMVAVIAMLSMQFAFTQKKGIVNDAEGNTYTTIKLGKQVWMAENLRSTRLNDGTPIGQVPDDGAWKHLNNAAFCDYNNNDSLRDELGLLYNWYCVGEYNACPIGWHVPNENDISILIKTMSKKKYLSNGDKTHFAKALAGHSGWDYDKDPGTPGNAPNLNNKAGFGAYPAGLRDADGEFSHQGFAAYFWTNYGNNENTAVFFMIGAAVPDMRILELQRNAGLSIRCLKD